MSAKPASTSDRRFLPSRCWSYSSTSNWIDHGNARQRSLHLVQAFLDALGDGDFALAGEQFHRTHLAHVHAHRIGGAADFGIDRRKYGDGFLGCGFVVGGDRVFRQHGFGIGRDLMHLDAHVVDHADDVFDLLRIDDVVGQVIVDLGVGQVPLLLALDDQGLDFGLLLLCVRLPTFAGSRGGL